MAHARLSALLLSAAGLLHLARRASAFRPPSTGHSLVPHLRAARCPAPLANEYDDWWDERRAKHAAVDNQAWAAAKAREAAYDTGSAAGRAALRAAPCPCFSIPLPVESAFCLQRPQSFLGTLSAFLFNSSI